jgi:hypothetical protein
MTATVEITRLQGLRKTQCLGVSRCRSCEAAAEGEWRIASGESAIDRSLFPARL